MNLCCPACGNESFTTTLTARIEYTYVCDDNAGIIERMDTIVSGGDLGDATGFTCDDCGEDFTDLSEDTLCTGDRTCMGFGTADHEYCND